MGTEAGERVLEWADGGERSGIKDKGGGRNNRVLRGQLREDVGKNEC